jgi:hypothetical protein
MDSAALTRTVWTFALPLVVLGQLVTLPPLLPPPFQPPPSQSAPVQEPWSGFPEVGAALFEDTASVADPVPLWGSVDCQERSRHELGMGGGDAHPTAQLRSQDDEAFRRLRVLDGDDYFGERCELGRNDHRESPVALYREGRRRLTFLSIRVPPDFPLDGTTFQVVMQMKQSQPSANGGGVPALALQAKDGRWRLYRGLRQVWSGPAQVGVWTRFAFDVTYSRKPEIGSVKVYADTNGDGDATDQGEESAQIIGRTLKPERKGGPPDGIRPGKSIPSHLRVGLYHHPSIGCPAPSGCFIDVDNVGVYEPG